MAVNADIGTGIRVRVDPWSREVCVGDTVEWDLTGNVETVEIRPDESPEAPPWPFENHHPTGSKRESARSENMTYDPAVGTRFHYTVVTGGGKSGFTAKIDPEIIIVPH